MASDIFKRFRNSAAADEDDDESGASTAYHRIREAEILAAIDKLPALPVVVQRLLGTMSDDKSDSRALEDLISQDMVIAGRVLKLVNSPFYMLPNNVASLQQAVTILGQRSLRSLVVAVSTRDVLATDLSSYGFVESGLWLNSMVTAGLARRGAELALAKGDIADEAFICGLLRDVGMLVLGPMLAKKNVVLTRESSVGIDIIDRERSTLGYDHCWVGERVAEKWNLSAHLKQTIGRHHRVPATMTDTDLQLMALVRVAERISYNARIGVRADHPFDTTIDGPLLRTANLDQGSFRSLLAEMPQIAETAKADL